MSVRSETRSSLVQRVKSRLARRRAGGSGAGGSSSRSGAVDALRDSWSQYPGDWKRDPRLKMGVKTLGEEWGGPEFADHVVDLVSDYLGPNADVLELGCGGGKFSQRLAPRCR